jgi:hypothetical protein
VPAPAPAKPAPTPAAKVPARPSSARLQKAKPPEPVEPVAVEPAPEGAPAAELEPAAAPADAQPAAKRKSSTVAAQPATGRSARQAGGTSRLARPGTGRVAKPDRGIGRYVVFGLLALVVVGALSYGPVTRSMALAKLDSFKGDPAKIDAALVAANDYIRMVDGSPSYLRAAIAANRGPAEAQVHMAKEAKLFSSLVQIAERPLSDPPPGPDGKAEAPPAADARVVSQDQRLLALNTAIAIYNPETMASELLPDDIAKWAKDGQLKRELAIASMQLMAKAKAKSANETFTTIAIEPGQDPARVEAAIDGIAALAEPDNLGYAIGLLGSRVSDLAVSRTELTDRIIKLASPNQLTRLVELLSSPKDAVRAIAIEAMGSPHMQLGDSPDHYRKREELGKSITPKLSPETSPVELAAALKAVKGLRLSGARDAVLALVPKLKTLHLEGITDDFMAELLGKAMISTVPKPDADKAGDKQSDAERLAAEAHHASEDLVAKLATALDDEASRTIAARALARINDTTFMTLRPALDKLAAHGDDADCFTTLLTLVDKTYGRPDVVKANGKDLEKWKAYLAEDRPRFDRVKEIIDWMAANKQYQYVKDGKARLTESKDWLGKAQEELDGWMQDKAFVPPLGLTHRQLDNLDQDVKMLGVNVRKAWSGALE